MYKREKLAIKQFLKRKCEYQFVMRLKAIKYKKYIFY